MSERVLAKTNAQVKWTNITGLTIRLTEFLHGHGYVVHGDSTFAFGITCTALLEKSTYFSGILKTAHKGFPKMFCQKLAIGPLAQHGDTVTIQQVHGVASTSMGMFGTSQVT